MPSALYSLRTDGDQYRITKFVDGEPEGSYLVSERECTCPAGHRHTCRHRQMLASMLAHGLANTHWFFAFDTGGQIVDFNGTSKHLLDQLADCRPAEQETAKDTSSLDAMFDELARIPGVQMVTLDDPATLHNTIADALGESRQCPQGSTAKPWRRL